MSAMPGLRPSGRVPAARSRSVLMQSAPVGAVSPAVFIAAGRRYSPGCGTGAGASSSGRAVAHAFCAHLGPGSSEPARSLELLSGTPAQSGLVQYMGRTCQQQIGAKLGSSPWWQPNWLTRPSWASGRCVNMQACSAGGLPFRCCSAGGRAARVAGWKPSINCCMT